MLGFVEEGVGVLDVLAEPFDLIVPIVDVGERVQLGLVVVEDVLEGQLLLLKLSNALLVDLAFFLVLKPHCFYLFGQIVDFIFHVIGLLLCKVVPFLFLLVDQSVSVPQALIEYLNEGFEYVIEEEGPDERPMLRFLLHETDLLSQAASKFVLFQIALEIVLIIAHMTVGSYTGAAEDVERTRRLLLVLDANLVPLLLRLI